MDTLTRAARTGRRRGLALVGPALVALGFLLMTLGILEIGGLFNVGVGLVTTIGGSVVVFAGEGRWPSDPLDGEEEFLRELDDL